MAWVPGVCVLPLLLGGEDGRALCPRGWKGGQGGRGEGQPGSPGLAPTSPLAGFPAEEGRAPVRGFKTGEPRRPSGD